MADRHAPVSGVQYLTELLMVLVTAVRTHLRLLLSVPLIVMAIAYLAAQWLPVVFSAQANVRLGRTDGSPTVTSQAAAALVQSATFKSDVVKAMELPLSSGETARMILGSLNARSETTDTLTMAVRGPTEDQARKALDVAFGLLRREEEQVSEPILANLKVQSENIDANLVTFLQIRDSLTALKGSVTEETKDPDQLAGAPGSFELRRLDVLLRTESLIAAARADRAALAVRIGSLKSYPATLVTVATSRISFGSTKLVVLSGALTFLALLAVVMLRRRKDVRPNEALSS